MGGWVIGCAKESLGVNLCPLARGARGGKCPDAAVRHLSAFV